METFETIKYFLVNTPWYVYLILFYLIKIGMKALRGGIISIKKLFFIPALFLFMSLDQIATKLSFNWSFMVAFIAGIACGTLFGYWQYKSLKIEVDQDKKVIRVSGSKLSFILIIATFILKYYIGYTLDTNPNIALGTMALLLFVSSSLTGIFIGRLLFALQRLKYGSSTNLDYQNRKYIK